MELCGWGRYLASHLHVRRAGARRVHARPRATPAASCTGATTRRSRGSRTRPRPSQRCARGAKLIVVDPRRAGLASKADHWLRVRPGHRRRAGAGDHARDDRARLVRRGLRPPLDERAAPGARRHRPAPARRRGLPGRRPGHFVAWDDVAGHRWRTTRRRAATTVDETAARAGRRVDVRHVGGRSSAGRCSTCSPSSARACTPQAAEAVTGVPADQIERRRADAVGVAAGRVLHLERARAAQQHDPDDPRDQRALRADRLPRRAGRQRAVHARADQPRSTARAARARAARQGDRRRGAPARPGAVRVRHRRGLLRRRARRRPTAPGRSSTSAPTWSWPTATAPAGATRSRRSTSSSTPTCS